MILGGKGPLGFQPGFSPEPPTQAGSLCYKCFPECRAICQSHPSGYNPGPGVATRRRNVALAYARDYKGADPAFVLMHRKYLSRLRHLCPFMD